MTRSSSEGPRTKQGLGYGSMAHGNDLDWAYWSSDDVAKWVDQLLGESLGTPFREMNIDGPTLLELNDSDFQSLLITNRLHRQKLIGHVKLFQMRRALLAQVADRRRAEVASSRASSPDEGADSIHGGVHRLCRSNRGSRNASPAPSRAPTETSSFSGSMSHTSSRYSRYTNPSCMSTAGLDSYFGLDSPSNSLRGSFSTAMRYSPLRSAPGPCTYSPTASFLSTSPRATFGFSPRHTAEHFISQGGGDYISARRLAKAKGGCIGVAPRWCARGRPSPGPGSYHPRYAYLSVFK